ncbi:uncharacterized protein LOC112524962 [Cynara cardunculus var. scolymus]|uniref:uncharacterized protein LOC112524962 n=1 Tax=Cynara cardunculus var. scolymus TaxID=59895 RepID=UPI000D6269E3|nr:uncharacterized protein LOC112524962 [Cynara cardunculus var. scolymus]
MASPDSWEWIDVMSIEIDSMCENQVWNLVEPPKKVLLIRWKWVFKKKNEMDGNVIINKARLVVKGKANVVVDALSRQEKSGTIKAVALRVELLPSIHEELQEFQHELMKEDKVKQERLGGLISVFVKDDRVLEVSKQNLGTMLWWSQETYLE